MNLCIIVPFFNEANRIPLKDFEKFLYQFPKVNLHFVNDGSSDNTSTALISFQKRHPLQVYVIHLAQNIGKGNAVRKGILNALENNGYDTFAFLDADLSTSLEECEYLARSINSSIQFVFGSRIKKNDNYIERGWFRFIISRIIATVISKVIDLAIYDTQCGCKIFSKEAAKIAFCKPFISTWLFDVEIFFRLKNNYGASKFKVLSSEIPIKKWKDQGDSKIKWTYSFKIWIDLFRIISTYK